MASEPDAWISIDGVEAGQGSVVQSVDQHKEVAILVRKAGFYPEERKLQPVKSKADLKKKDMVICLYPERAPVEKKAGVEPTDDRSNKGLPPNAPTCAILAFALKSGEADNMQNLLTDRFMVEFGQRAEYRIVDRERMTAILSELKLSQSGYVKEGAVEIGNLLGVQYVIYGSVAKVGRLYTANVYMVSVETGAQVASATVDVDGELEDFLMTGMADVAAKLIARGRLPNE